MSNTPENCEKVANSIVGRMSLAELQQFAYDDLYSIMLEHSDVYEMSREIEETENE